jgi:hypothetical protein
MGTKRRSDGGRAIACSSFPLAPVLRGEGWGEGPTGLSMQVVPKTAPHPWPSPHAYMGRGDQRGTCDWPGFVRPPISVTISIREKPSINVGTGLGWAGRLTVDAELDGNAMVDRH